VLELDHVFCLVSEPGAAAKRLEADGWALDAGQAHRGQGGTRNRRLAWSELFFELLWVTDADEARANPAGLRARSHRRGGRAAPGVAFDGELPSPTTGPGRIE
jgi:hypothetical protein